MVKIAPSILSADFSRLQAEIEQVDQAGADWIHVDVMDGHFVPNITFGPLVVHAIRPYTKKTIDVHLMIEQPDRYIPQFIDRGADVITVHQEACPHLHRTLSLIKEGGIQAGVAINPATPVSFLQPILSEVDVVCCMTVNPGFGGQQFIPSVVDKIEELRSIKERYSYSFEIEVDGGINAQTTPQVVQAGATVLVAGSAIFGQEDIPQAMNHIRHKAEGVKIG